MMEPYRIKVVEPIPVTTRTEREEALARVGYNLFGLRADEVTIDLLTDSGTGAVSAAQQAAAANGDESYAGSRSFFRFHDVVSELTGYPHIFPVHQGRAAERMLFTSLLTPGRASLSNTHFDTTRANIELLGCRAVDLPCPQAQDLDSPDPFKGNIDLVALETALAAPDTDVGLVLMTLTNNGGGGQPVSMANLTSVAQLCRAYGVPFFLDAARFAENAWLVIQREPGLAAHTPGDVARAAFDLADGAIASLKKDGISPSGGFLALRDDELAQRCELLLIATEGFPTYGGLAGRDLDTLAQGLREVLDPRYLQSRADAAAHLAARLTTAGVSVVQPPGLHALYVNAGRLLAHLPPQQIPGHALACQLYLDGGIRTVELGSLYLGQYDESGNLLTPAPYELVRLALPRRVYTQSHLDHVADVLATIAKHPERVPGYRIVESPPILRHFKSRFAPVL